MTREDKLDENTYLLSMAGETSVAVLDSTIQRLAKNYCTKGFLGTKQSIYNQFAKGWSGYAWDIMILRSSVNYLMHEGFAYNDAIKIIRDFIYMNIYPVHHEGRPEGVKGEKSGDGRKTRGTRMKFKLGNHKREWVQIGICNSVAMLIDMMGAYRKYKTGRDYTWSRQKVLTFMSMANKHKDYHHPHMTEFFINDEIL
jgi:hypothetical protein